MGVWSLNTSFLTAPVFLSSLASVYCLNPRSACPTSTAWLQVISKEIKAAAMEHANRLNVIKDAKLRDLTERLKSLEDKLTSRPNHPTLRLSIKATKSLIFKIVTRKQNFVQQHAAAKYFKEGEKCTKYFAAFAKKRQAHNVIKALANGDGPPATTTSQILETATAFYRDLYSSMTTDQEAQDLLLSKIIKKITPDTAAALDVPITPEEVSRAIKEATPNKSPGLDGLPAELWKNLNEIAKPLAELFNEWMTLGEIPASCKEGLVTLLFKKGDPLDVRNYRPITLLNSVLKILTKALNNRLKTVMDELITPTQTGMSGRYIGETIRTMADILTHSRSTNSPLALLLLDQEKAFDKVSHQFLGAALVKFGFGPGFRQWIHLLYHNATSRLKINNTLGDQFELSRGVRQGDCLSPNLFVIAIEPFLRAIISDPEIHGVELPGGSCIKIMGYADDVTPVTTHREDIPRFEYWMKIYEKATGATFSKAKSELLAFGMELPINSTFFSTTVYEPSHQFRFLGVPLALHPDLNAAWEGPLIKFEKCLKTWSRCYLSLHGRTVVLQHFAHPILTYLTAVLPLTTYILKQVTKASWKFMWNGRKAKVNLETAKLSTDLGGIGYPDFVDTVTKIQARWVARLLADWTSQKPWVHLAKWSISRINEKWGHGTTSLITPGSRHDADSSPSNFWAAATTSFWKCNPHYKLEEPKNQLLTRSLPLFHNPLILDHNG